jgi:hypothetical protein
VRLYGVRRADDTEHHLLQPGEYCKSSREGGPCFLACTPDGRLADLSRHQVTEHQDGTITVSPSILVSGGGEPGNWHGYLEDGIWRAIG